MRRAEPVWLESRGEYARRYPRSAARIAATRTVDEFATACLPLTADRRPLGAISFAFAHARAIDDDERSFMTVLSQHSALALERVRLFEALKLAEERQRLAVSATRLGTWDHCLRTKSLTWDARCRELFEMTADEAITCQRFLSALHPEDVDRVRREIARATSRGSDGQYEAEFRIVGLGQERCRWIASRGECFFDEGGDPVRFVGTAVDVSERKRAAEELRSSAERAQQACVRAKDAERRKDEFLAMLGHELRNPLAPIHTALQLLRMRGEKGLERERTIIERQVRHLERLVSDLLDVSRITRGKIQLKRERVELVDIVAKAVELASPLLEQKDHRLTLDVPARGLVADADHVRLTQVLTNLLANAAKYSERGGEITVAAHREGDRLVVRVTDSGAGMAAELLPHVFDLFTQAPQTLARSEGGLGLGLTIAKSLVELHDGRIEAFSEGRGRGSQFVVTLPASTARASNGSHAANGSTAASRTAVHAARVLVVDDNRDAAETLAEALTMEGHEVSVAYDGPSALEVAARCSPEIVLLDIGLPVIDGYEVARRLRQAHAAPLKLIAVTGYGQENDRARAADAGFDAHLVKPVELGLLLQTVDQRDVP